MIRVHVQTCNCVHTVNFGEEGSNHEDASSSRWVSILRVMDSDDVYPSYSSSIGREVVNATAINALISDYIHN